MMIVSILFLEMISYATFNQKGDKEELWVLEESKITGVVIEIVVADVDEKEIVELEDDEFEVVDNSEL